MTKVAHAIMMVTLESPCGMEFMNEILPLSMDTPGPMAFQCKTSAQFGLALWAQVFNDVRFTYRRSVVEGSGRGHAGVNL